MEALEQATPLVLDTEEILRPSQHMLLQTGSCKVTLELKSEA